MNRCVSKIKIGGQQIMFIVLNLKKPNQVTKKKEKEQKKGSTMKKKRKNRRRKNVRYAEKSIKEIAST